MGLERGRPYRGKGTFKCRGMGKSRFRQLGSSGIVNSEVKAPTQGWDLLEKDLVHHPILVTLKEKGLRGCRPPKHSGNRIFFYCSIAEIFSFHLICNMSRLIYKQPNYERKRITRCVWRQSHCGLSLIYPNDTYTLLDSQIWMIADDLKYVNVANEIEYHTTWELKNCKDQYISLD